MEAQQLREMIANAYDAMSVRRVFADPIERDGLTVIPAASVRGGAGGGEGTQKEGHGWGQGYGLAARPAGMYVIKGGDVSWSPAVDVNRIVLGGQIVVIVALLTARAIIKARGRR